MIGPKITSAVAAQMPAAMLMRKPESVSSQGVGQTSGSTSRRPGEQTGGAAKDSAGGAPDLLPRAASPDLAAPGVPSSRAAPPAAKASQTPEAMWKAARDFEAMVIGQLLQPMFETVDNSKSPFSGGHGEQAFKPMIVQEMAKKIAAGGGFGLAQPIYAQMLRMQEGVRP